ncbi:tRNA (N6-threonylcarbamoyladenosine(37)-N6)-methyltransferase TrmO [Oleidesulfovibrio alaskensis]|uniref:tRNA (N6-threonylcarbamoyladenosine(37)-N6)-methyltransferase TrmO n=1 Tax=Oleidesulfovibrio alaskensis TaxID=58180 RepID=UPI001A5504D8|nr:tRNA (N6-threonylcarbamoyladenosine(37)-N6)-methyltransferase TrmO [Oleidesulfovibrio alaskensis]MBL3580975.1 tRNA (N6-threonylcarbamoyladenosine(37)-N6)-methyltransferase TrmO [Oleidesulfovibrio alaskensis]
MTAELRFIGVVRSSLKDIGDCPKQGDEGGVEAWVDIHEEYRAGLDSLRAGQGLTLLTWLHEADRSVLSVHPRGDTGRPRRGVFNTRSPARPNPVGLHEVRLTAVEDGRLKVAPLEALDGTPVIDIKTSFDQRSGTGGAASHAAPQGAAAVLRHACRTAWERGLLSGFNGNISLRIDSDTCLVTCTGSVKGDLHAEDTALVRIDSGERLAGGVPSSETAMHLAIYRNQPQAQAVVHTHPPCLLALGIRVAADELLRIPVYESDLIRRRMTSVPAHAPGSQELAQAAGEAARTHEAVYMERHGLVCWAGTVRQALALSEEIEHLAGMHLRASGI